MNSAHFETELKNEYKLQLIGWPTKRHMHTLKFFAGAGKQIAKIFSERWKDSYTLLVCFQFFFLFYQDMIWFLAIDGLLQVQHVDKNISDNPLYFE